MFDQLEIASSGYAGDAAARKSQFTGREWLFAHVDDFISRHRRGYLLIEGEAGVGKSTFALWLAHTRQYACHFTRLPGGRTSSAASKNLAAQLITAVGLEEAVPRGVFPSEAAEPHWLQQLITTAAARQQAVRPDTPLVLVVDGLDQAEPTIGTPLGLPSALPDGVFVIATMRTGTPVRWLEEYATCKLSSSAEENLDDLRRYLQAAAREPEIAGKLRSGGRHR